MIADPSRAEDLPPVLRDVYSSAAFLSRLALHTGAPLGLRVESWLPLSAWWQRAGVNERVPVLAHAEEIARDVEELTRWTPPDPPLPGTLFADLYTTLANVYLEARGGVRVRRHAPGPLGSGRHPGFAITYEPRRRRFVAREHPSPLLPARLELAFSFAADVPSEPRFEGHVFSSYGMPDAWEVFALRAILLALYARSDEAAATLARDLGRPGWVHLLEHLGDDAKATSAAPREWAFALVPGRDSYELVSFARRAADGKRAPKWKKESFEALYGEDAATADPRAHLEREIARLALCSTDRRGTSRLALGTPHGHELLRLLAQHPRVTTPLALRPDPESDPTAEIVVGDATMRLERAPNGSLSPRFFVGAKELSASMLDGTSTAGFRGDARGSMIVSAFVPKPLRKWLTTAARMGAALAFPPESVPKLAASTERLVSAGVAELPRDALGEELAYEVAAALRVEWRVEGAAVVEVFASVHPSAPLVAPGLGPELYTFEHAGRRVFVERDLAREVKLAKEAREQISAPLTWDAAVGRTEGLPDALELAAWLERNPLGLRIEVKVGRPPVAFAWDEMTRSLEVSKAGAWLVLDGALDVAGAKLTIGDVLDAARLARRYVKAADGVFLELSKQAIERLQPVAFATELGGGRAGDVRLHDAFGAVLAEAGRAFSHVRGVDLEPYVKRFEARATKVRVPPLDHGELRPYQRDGVAWMLRLASWAPGCVLADDMGLGKTVQTAAVLKARARLGPQLIVAPASVSSNWMRELERFVPSLSARWYNEDRAITPAELDAGDVIVVSYGLLQKQGDAFGGQRWATVVVDEAQYVKNAAAQRTDAIRALDRAFTIALTGTPLENHLGELFSITDLVFPGLLGDEATFRERFRRPIEATHRDATRLAALGRLLAPFLLRRTRGSVLGELPPRDEITEYVDLGPDEKKRYLALRRACEQQFAKRKKQETAAQLKIALLAALTRLRQLACDVRLVDPSFEGGSSKIARVVELAAEIAAGKSHALVFSQFTQLLERIRAELEAAGLRVAYLAGDTPTTKRRALVDAFQAGEYDVFCVSLLAGGTGLNLTRASYVIHTDPWWNPAAEEQATSRAHRMGQTDPVTVIRLVARGTIEEAVLAMHAAKRELAAAILDGKADAKGRAMTPSELLELLRFGADHDARSR